LPTSRKDEEKAPAKLEKDRHNEERGLGQKKALGTTSPLRLLVRVELEKVNSRKGKKKRITFDRAHESGRMRAQALGASRQRPRTRKRGCRSCSITPKGTARRGGKTGPRGVAGAAAQKRHGLLYCRPARKKRLKRTGSYCPLDTSRAAG